jgi:hypothetical protein
VGDAAAEVAPDEVAAVVVVVVAGEAEPPTVTFDRRAPERLEFLTAAPKLDFK